MVQVFRRDVSDVPFDCGDTLIAASQWQGSVLQQHLRIYQYLSLNMKVTAAIFKVSSVKDASCFMITAHAVGVSSRQHSLSQELVSR